MLSTRRTIKLQASTPAWIQWTKHLRRKICVPSRGDKFKQNVPPDCTSASGPFSRLTIRICMALQAARSHHRSAWNCPFTMISASQPLMSSFPGQVQARAMTQGIMEHRTKGRWYASDANARSLGCDHTASESTAASLRAGRRRHRNGMWMRCWMVSGSIMRQFASGDYMAPLLQRTWRVGGFVDTFTFAARAAEEDACTAAAESAFQNKRRRRGWRAGCYRRCAELPGGLQGSTEPGVRDCTEIYHIFDAYDVDAVPSTSLNAPPRAEQALSEICLAPRALYNTWATRTTAADAISPALELRDSRVEDNPDPAPFPTEREHVSSSPN
ncbi:hypothetical protein R3P38DRAFT_3256047 [Favolaschia claudopus]|uniref:Uncharacterized protein n=1 Tax=Favolaschia claudopus TaxID=2862362 RepID=A0AAW0DCB9_9AGAR